MSDGPIRSRWPSSRAAPARLLATPTSQAMATPSAEAPGDTSKRASNSDISRLIRACQAIE